MPAISTEGMTRSNLDELMTKTHDLMSTTFTKVSEEVLQNADKKSK